MASASSRWPRAKRAWLSVSARAEVPGVMSNCSASGRPSSRACSALTAASVPPALSPPTAMRVASSPSVAPCRKSARSAAMLSSTAQGKRCSGASR
jgi:hypothetical protein